jgi:hypothetical protein
MNHELTYKIVISRFPATEYIRQGLYLLVR